MLAVGWERQTGACRFGVGRGSEEGGAPVRSFSSQRYPFTMGFSAPWFFFLATRGLGRLTKLTGRKVDSGRPLQLCGEAAPLLALASHPQQLSLPKAPVRKWSVLETEVSGDHQMGTQRRADQLADSVSVGRTHTRKSPSSSLRLRHSRCCPASWLAQPRPAQWVGDTTETPICRGPLPQGLSLLLPSQGKRASQPRFWFDFASPGQTRVPMEHQC